MASLVNVEVEEYSSVYKYGHSARLNVAVLKYVALLAMYTKRALYSLSIIA